MAEIHIKGLSELQKFLDTLPAKLEENITRGALRAGMRVIQKEARRNIHSVSGVLAKGLKISTSTRSGKVVASLKATGPHAFIAHMLEFTGAIRHTIKAKKGGALSFAGGVYRSIEHPGFKKKPFMRPALDAEAQGAVIAAAEYMRKRLATKHGIDTDDIVIEAES